jgi:hypothetical protein
MISNDREMMISKLHNFERIDEKAYSDIDTGTYIRYITFDKPTDPRRPGAMKLRLGGVLVVNRAPDYWVLRSGSKGKSHITWSVPLKCDPKKSPQPNVYFKRKGMPLKSEKQQHSGEALTILTSGKYKLVPIETINECTRLGIDLSAIGAAAASKPNLRTVLMDRPDTTDYETDGTDESEEPIRKTKVTLRE